MNHKNKSLTSARRAAAMLLFVVARAATAGPFIQAGDVMLRDDIQRLADYRVLSGPVSTWPLAWGPILADLQRFEDIASLPPDVSAAYGRVRFRARQATRVDELDLGAELVAGSNARVIRSFADTPREDFEATAKLGWIGSRLSFDLAATLVSSPADDQDLRADGSAVAVTLGNYTLSLNTQERWWGPGWDGSLILSNNARPVPALSLDRNFKDPFETRWLSWLGPWDFSVMMGQLESERFVPNALLFGMRFSFRPLGSLEISLSRTAQWCGDGRPCDLSTFTDLLLGKDNLGSSGVGVNNEPGNQLAGVDFRWINRWFGRPVSFYGQFIGEDEAGGFPSRYLGLLGAELSGMLNDRWSYRVFGEFAGTSCDFYDSNELFDCAYTHGIYQTGYRYRGRAIGHALDADARVVSAGVVLVSESDQMLQALGRYGALNRGILPDPNHSLASRRQELASFDVSYQHAFRPGLLELGTGVERRQDESAGVSETDVRLFARWQFSF